jgi:hypothetical protein
MRFAELTPFSAKFAELNLSSEGVNALRFVLGVPFAREKAQRFLFENVPRC